MGREAGTSRRTLHPVSDFERAWADVLTAPAAQADRRRPAPATLGRSGPAARARPSGCGALTPRPPVSLGPEAASSGTTLADVSPGLARVACIIPAKDEQDRVAATVTAARALPGVEIVIVCDDGSSDATAEHAAAAGAVVVSHERNRGKAAAVESAVNGLGVLEQRDRRPEVGTLLLLDADLGASAARCAPLIERRRLRPGGPDHRRPPAAADRRRPAGRRHGPGHGHGAAAASPSSPAGRRRLRSRASAA